MTERRRLPHEPLDPAHARPWQVEVDKKGYIEDRRPNANMDPYIVAKLITEVVCEDAAR